MYRVLLDGLLQVFCKPDNEIEDHGLKSPARNNQNRTNDEIRKVVYFFVVCISENFVRLFPGFLIASPAWMHAEA